MWVGVTHSESPSAPRAATSHLIQVGKSPERSRVPQGHIDDAVVGQRAHCRKRRALLASALGGGGDEDAGVLTSVAPGLPLLAGLIPEGLPLGGEVAVAGGDAEEEGVVFRELLGGDEGDGVGLAGGVHLAEDFLG